MGHVIRRLLAGALALTLCGYSTWAEAAGAPPPPPPAATTIVNYDFERRRQLCVADAEFSRAGTTSMASSTQPFAELAASATDGSAFTMNATAGVGPGSADTSGQHQVRRVQLGGASLPLQALQGLRAGASDLERGDDAHTGLQHERDESTNVPTTHEPRPRTLRGTGVRPECGDGARPSKHDLIPLWPAARSAPELSLVIDNCRGAGRGRHVPA